MAARVNITNVTATEGDVAEAAALLGILYFVFENADTPDEWFRQRENIGWLIANIENTVRRGINNTARVWEDIHAANGNLRAVQ